MKYALIKNNTVVNVIIADSGFIQTIQQEYDHIEALDTELEQSLGVGVGWGWDGSFTPPVAPETPSPEPVEPPVYEWYIDIGPFVDRLGTKSLAVDTSTDPIVQAFSKDLARRKWVNLQDPRVASTLGYLAGDTLPGIGTISSPILTSQEVTDVLTTPVEPEENLALRKQYFS